MVARTATGDAIASYDLRQAAVSGYPAKLGRLELALIMAIIILSMSPGFDWLIRKFGFGQSLVYAIWALLYIGALTHLTLRLGVRWIAWTLTKLWVIWVIVGVCVLSSAWSPEPAPVLRRSLSLVGTTVVGTYAAMLLPPERLLRYIFTAVGILTVWGVFVAIFVPSYGTMAWGGEGSEISDAWRGVVGHKQAFGAYMAYMAMICLAKMTGRNTRHWLWIGLFGLFGVFTVLAQSATALLCIAGAAGLVVLMVLLRQMEIPSIIARFSIFYAFALITVFALINVGTFMQTIGKADTFDNRLRVWGEGIGMIKDSPFLGLGFEVAWDQEIYPQFQQPPYHPHSHNGYLNLASQIGVPATVLMVGFMCVVFARAVRLYFDRPTVFNRFAMIYLGAFFVMNITRSLLFKFQGAEWITYLMVVTAVVIQDQLSRKSAVAPPASDDRPAEVPERLWSSP